MRHHDGALRWRLRALESLVNRDRTGTDDEAEALPQCLDLPPLVLPKDAWPSKEQLYEGFPRGQGYVLFVVPGEAPPLLDEDGQVRPEPETHTILRLALRRGQTTATGKGWRRR
jgi:hypothetical protein